MSRSCIAALCVALVMEACSVSSTACNVPVFRYALEKWPPDEYSGVIFHRGPLNGPDAAVLEKLKSRATDESAPVNISISTVDLDGKVPADVTELARTYETGKLPRLTIFCPLAPGVHDGKAEDRIAWSGVFDEGSIKGLLDSPARQDAVARLLQGDSIVWLFVDSGDQVRDDRVAKELSGHLSALQEAIKIMPHTGGEEGEQVPGPDSTPPVASPEKLLLPVIRISAGDPAEKDFRVLLHALAKADGLSVDGPLVFPVFGRGRAVAMISDKGITREALERICTYLTGDCSCEVKGQNPGIDLLMGARWDDVGQGTYVKEVPLPDLTGVMPLINQSGTGILARPLGPTVEHPRANPETSHRKLVNKIILIMILCGVAVAVASAMIMRRPGA